MGPIRHLKQDDIFCPNCNELMDGYRGVSNKSDSRPPEPGDITICLYCLSINRWTGTKTNLSLEHMTNKELAALSKQQPEAYRELLEIMPQTRMESQIINEVKKTKRNKPGAGN